MFYTKKHFAGVNLTQDFLEVVILEKRGGRLHFVSAEKCQRDTINFSEDVNQFYKPRAYIFGALGPEETLLHSIEVPPLKRGKKVIIKEALSSHRALSEAESAVAQIKVNKKKALQPEKVSFLEARKSSIFKTIECLKEVDWEPHSLGCSFKAVQNFALYVCEKDCGIFLHLEENRGTLVALQNKEIVFCHTFAFDLISDCEKVFHQIRFALGSLQNEGIFSASDTIYITGPASFDVHLVTFLRAALCRKIIHPELKDSLAPANMCHSFTISLGLALEASLPKAQRVDFRKGSFSDIRLVKRAVYQESMAAACVLAGLLSLSFLGHTFLHEKDRSLSIGFIQEALKVPCTLETPNFVSEVEGLDLPEPMRIFENFMPNGSFSLFSSAHLKATAKAFRKSQIAVEKNVKKAPLYLLYPSVQLALMELITPLEKKTLSKFNWRLKPASHEIAVTAHMELGSQKPEMLKRAWSKIFDIYHFEISGKVLKVGARLKPRLR